MLCSNGKLQCYTPMLHSNVMLQCYATMLFYHAKLQCYTLMLHSNVTLQCNATMLQYDAKLQCYASTSRCGVLLQRPALTRRPCPLSRHRDGADLAGRAAGGGVRHRPPVVRVSEPLRRGGQAPGAGAAEPTAGRRPPVRAPGGSGVGPYKPFRKSASSDITSGRVHLNVGVST